MEQLQWYQPSVVIHTDLPWHTDNTKRTLVNIWMKIIDSDAIRVSLRNNHSNTKQVCWYIQSCYGMQRYQQSTDQYMNEENRHIYYGGLSK